MNNAIFYKEWIKTRWYLLAIVIAGIVLEVLMFLKLGRTFRFAGHEHLWSVIINRYQFMFPYIKYFPLAAGLVLSAAQFLPEITNSRLKLSLHLPMKETKTISSILGFASGTLTLLFLIQIIMLLLGARYFFAIEIVSSIFHTILPWFIAGLTGYFLFAFCAFEPIWKRKVVNLMLSCFIIYLFFIRDLPGAYSNTIYFLALVPLVSLLFVYYSVYRFKIGVQAA